MFIWYPIEYQYFLPIYSLYIYYIYTGWWLTYPSEKYEFVSWDDEFPNIWKNKTCSKPPTSIVFPILVPWSKESFVLDSGHPSDFGKRTHVEAMAR
jgi:hypothetical protein